MASSVAVEASLSAPRLPDNLSDDDEDITGKVGPIDSDEAGTPRDTVEENGAGDEDEDEDDLFGDGGEEEERPLYVAGMWNHVEKLIDWQENAPTLRRRTRFGRR